MTTQKHLDPFPIRPGSRALIQTAGWLARTTHRKDAQDFTSELTHALYYGISFAVYYPEEARAILARENLFGPEGHEVMARDLGIKLRESLEERYQGDDFEALRTKGV